MAIKSVAQHAVSIPVVLLAMLLSIEARADNPTTASSAEMDDPRIAAAVEKLTPQDVREGKREPTDRERLAAAYAFLLLGAENGRLTTKEGNPPPTTQQRQQAIDQRLEQIRAEHGNGSDEVKKELVVLENLIQEQMRLLDFLDVPKRFPSEAARVDDLVERLERIPSIVDRTGFLSEEIPFHEKRIELLKQIDQLKPQSNDSQTAEKLGAAQRLLESMDQTHRLQATYKDKLQQSAVR